MSTLFDDSFVNGDIIEAEHVKQVFTPIKDLESGAALYREASGTGAPYMVDFTADPYVRKNHITTTTLDPDSDLQAGQMIVFKANVDSPASASVQLLLEDGSTGTSSSAFPLTVGDTQIGAGRILENQIVVAIYNDTSTPRFDVVGLSSSGDGGAASLDDLTDVTISGTPSTDEFLKHDGTSFTNVAPSAVRTALDVPANSDLAAKEDAANKGAANGYASLDATGKVPSSQLPTGSGLSGTVTGYQVATGDNAGGVTSHSGLTWDGSSLTYSGTNAAELRGSGGSGTVAIGGSAVASASNSTSAGAGATASGIGSVALGNNAQATQNYCVVIGPSASITTTGAVNSTAVGYQATASYRYASAYGFQAGAAGEYGCAFGYSADVTGNNAVALGSYSSAALNATAVGYNSSASSSGTAIGGSSNASGSTSVAIGILSAATSTYGVAIGYGTDATNGVSIGYDASSYTNGIAIGLSATNSTGPYGIAIGNASNTGAGADNIRIGRSGTMSSSYGVLIGYGGSSSANCVGVGYGNTVSGSTSIGLGYHTTASGMNCVAISSSASASANSAIAVGYFAAASGGNALSVGFSSEASATNAIALGTDAVCSVQYGVAIGQTAQAATTNGGVAIGYAAYAEGGTALGRQTDATGAYSVAVGQGAQAVTGSYVIAVGSSSSASANDAMALGRSANAGYPYSIALGTQASTTASNQMVIGGPAGIINDVYIGNGVTYGAPGSATVNVTGGSGTDKAGGSLTLAGGKSTGTGIGGSVKLQTSAAGTTGTTPNSLSTMLEVTGDQKMGLFGATPVARSTGWTVSNASTNKSLDVSSATLSDVREVLGTVIDYLKTLGALGA